MPGGGEEVETNDNKNASLRKTKTNFQLAIYTKKKLDEYTKQTLESKCKKNNIIWNKMQFLLYL